MGSWQCDLQSHELSWIKTDSRFNLQCRVVSQTCDANVPNGDEFDEKSLKHFKIDIENEKFKVHGIYSRKSAFTKKFVDNDDETNACNVVMLSIQFKRQFQMEV